MTIRPRDCSLVICESCDGTNLQGIRYDQESTGFPFYLEKAIFFAADMNKERFFAPEFLLKAPRKPPDVFDISKAHSGMTARMAFWWFRIRWKIERPGTYMILARSLGKVLARTPFVIYRAQPDQQGFLHHEGPSDG